jgi:hypothetical protein
VDLISQLTPQQLRRIADLKEKITALEKSLEILIGQSPSKPKPPIIRYRKKMSAAARAKISAAQKARWAKAKAKK